MVAFHAKALERGKGKGSLGMVAASNPSAFGAGPSTAVDGGRKRKSVELLQLLFDLHAPLYDLPQTLGSLYDLMQRNI